MKTSAVNQYNPRGQSNLTLNSDMNILEKHDLLLYIRSAMTSDKTLLAEVGTRVFRLGDDPQHDLLMARAVSE